MRGQFLELDAGTFIRFKRRSSRVVCTGPIFYSIRCGNSTRPAARAARHLRRTCPPPKPNRRAPSRVARPPRRKLKIGPVQTNFVDLLLKLIKVPAQTAKNSPRKLVIGRRRLVPGESRGGAGPAAAAGALLCDWAPPRRAGQALSTSILSGGKKGGFSNKARV